MRYAVILLPVPQPSESSSPCPVKQRRSSPGWQREQPEEEVVEQFRGWNTAAYSNYPFSDLLVGMQKDE